MMTNQEYLNNLPTDTEKIILNSYNIYGILDLKKFITHTY